MKVVYRLTSSNSQPETNPKFETETKGYELHITAGDRRFIVTPHPGRQAAKARRLVQSLILPGVAEVSAITQAAAAKLTGAEKERFKDLQEQIQALDDNSKLLKEKDKELRELLSAHIEPGAMARAQANAAQSMSLEKEELLDALLFSNTKAKVGDDPYQKLEGSQFDVIFSGKHSALIDQVREAVIEFNGFLGQ